MSASSWVGPGELAGLLSPERRQALETGHAAIALSPSSLNAAVRITRSPLEPLPVTLLGSEDDRRYLLLEFRNGEVHKVLDLPPGSKPRILPRPRLPLDHGSRTRQGKS